MSVLNTNLSLKLVIIYFLSIVSVHAYTIVPLYVSMNNRINVVLSPQEAILHHNEFVWSILPSRLLSAAMESESSEISLQVDTLAPTIEQIPANKPSSAVEFIHELRKIADPLIDKYLSDDNETDTTMDMLQQSSLYLNVSSSLISYMVQNVTRSRLDFVILSGENTDNASTGVTVTNVVPVDESILPSYITGIELGVRPSSYYGIRMRFSNDPQKQSMSLYGIGLELYPNANTTIKISTDDNETEQTTGVELKMGF